MKLVVNRIENGFAVVETKDGNFENIPISALPDDVSEGAVIEVNILYEETAKKEKEIKEKLNNLFKK
jgi:hypothetical protein